MNHPETNRLIISAQTITHPGNPLLSPLHDGRPNPLRCRSYSANMAFLEQFELDTCEHGSASRSRRTGRKFSVIVAAWDGLLEAQTDFGTSTDWLKRN